MGANMCFLRALIPWVNEMPSPQKLVLSGIGWEKGVFAYKALLTWLGKRSRAGDTLDTIEFYHCAHNIKETLVRQFVIHRVTRSKLPIANKIV
jgi:hypothetical protein